MQEDIWFFHYHKWKGGFLATGILFQYNNFISKSREGFFWLANGGVDYTIREPLIDFGNLSNLDSLKLIVTGGRDDIAPAQMIETAYEHWNPDARFEIITGADHFFGGQLNRLEAIVQNYLEP